MLRGSFRDKAYVSDRKPVEAVLTEVSLWPETHMDWQFHFCTLRLDNGEHVRTSISNWDNSLMVGQRVRGLMLPKGKGIFTGHAHIDALERVGPPSVFKRFQTAIAKKFGR